MTTATGVSKGRTIVTNILIFLPGIALLGSSLAKFAHVPAVLAQMAALGFDGPRLMIIAVLELASAALLLLPRTRPFGLLLVSAYLGGAIAAHLGHGQPPEPPAVSSGVGLDRQVAEKRIHNCVAHRLGRWILQFVEATT